MSEMSAGASVPEQPTGAASGEQQNGAQVPGGPKKRRRGRRGGRNRNRTRTGGTNPAATNADSTQAAPRVARAPKPATPEVETTTIETANTATFAKSRATGKKSAVRG